MPSPWLFLFCFFTLGLVTAAQSGDFQEKPVSPEANRVFEVLSPPPWPNGLRTPLAEAASLLADRRLKVARAQVSADLLIGMSRSAIGEPMTRVMREAMGGAVDPDDFVFFLDDVLGANRYESGEEEIWITPSRARKAGIFIHPDEVFEGMPRRYGEYGFPSTDRPRVQSDLPPAENGDVLGPSWTMRFRNPGTESEQISELSMAPGSGDFAKRIGSLIRQLREQGAHVELTSTVRSPKRGYLMWGAFILSQADSEESSIETIAKLEEVNSDWGLFVPIRWNHPEGVRATQEAARAMADTYQVVFATEAGARSSDHYTGRAVDMVGVALPRHLQLLAPDGESGSFDLSGSQESRDLSLSPILIKWVEEHFGIKKLRGDYPHWVDGLRD